MKEDWINKLLELLNQYTKEEKESDIIWELDNDWDICHKYKESVDYNDCIYYAKIPVLISKSYGFIKRLIEKDKIDFSIIPNKIKGIWIPMKINWEIKYWFDSSDYCWLLMLLSIQDTPIDFLTKIIK